MALELTERVFRAPGSAERQYDDDSWEFAQDAYHLVHDMFLSLNHAISRAGPCAKHLLPAFRRDRDEWARYYSRGISRLPWRVDRAFEFQVLARQWQRRLMRVCQLVPAGDPKMVWLPQEKPQLYALAARSRSV